MSAAHGTDQVVSIETRMEQRERTAFPEQSLSVRELEDQLDAARADLTEAKTQNAMVGMMPAPATAADQAARAQTIKSCAIRVHEALEAKRAAERRLRAARAASQPWDRQRLWEAGW